MAVKRKIHFLQTHDVQGLPIRECLAPAVPAALAAIVAQGDARLGTPPRGALLGAPNGRHLTLYSVRDDDLPSLYRNNQIVALEDALGDENVEIAEPTYFGCFDNGVIGFVYNHYGPRASRLSNYLAGVGIGDFTFAPIIRQDVMNRIAGADGLKMLKVRVRNEENLDLGGTTLRSARRLVDENAVSDVEVVLRAHGEVEQRGFLQRVAESLGILSAQNARSAHVEIVEDGQSELIDLVAARVTVTREIDTVPGHKKYLDPQEAVQALDEAYDEARHQL
jgi:hypothetical protein